MSYPLERLHEEVAFLAIGLGWTHEELLQLSHFERARWIDKLNQINRKHKQQATGREDTGKP